MLGTVQRSSKALILNAQRSNPSILSSAGTVVSVRENAKSPLPPDVWAERETRAVINRTVKVNKYCSAFLNYAELLVYSFQKNPQIRDAGLLNPRQLKLPRTKTPQT